MRVIFVIIFICIASLCKANNIVKEFEGQYKEVQTISATFEQLTEDNVKITGEFYLKKPNKIIWKYLKPYPIIILISVPLCVVGAMFSLWLMQYGSIALFAFIILGFLILPVPQNGLLIFAGILISQGKAVEL